MDGSQPPPNDDRLRWNRLTDKQRACLDLVLERKTSKQIARQLGISKYTVDQRLTAARLALGASDRSDTANRYARLKMICDRIAYDPVEVPGIAARMPSRSADDGLAKVLGLAETSNAGHRMGDLSSGKIWRHDHRLQTRLAITSAIFVALVIFLLGSLGIAESLTRLVTG